jgi:DNA-binding IclR family transcriptional regulator
MSDDEILELFSRSEEPRRTTPEVATQLGISKPATWKRLSDLYDRGLLVKHPAEGLRSAAWSLSDEGRAALDEEPAAERS